MCAPWSSKNKTHTLALEKYNKWNFKVGQKLVENGTQVKKNREHAINNCNIFQFITLSHTQKANGRVQAKENLDFFLLNLRIYELR